jgi:hypothetical protein
MDSLEILMYEKYTSKPDNRLTVKQIYEDFREWVIVKFGISVWNNITKRQVYSALKQMSEYKYIRYKDGYCLRGIGYRPTIAEKFNVQTDNVQTYNIQNDNVQNDNVQNDNVQTYNIQNDNVQTYNIQNDNVRTDNVRTDNVRTDNVRTDNVRNDNIRNDNIRNDNIQTDKIKYTTLKIILNDPDKIHNNYNTKTTLKISNMIMPKISQINRGINDQ